MRDTRRSEIFGSNKVRWSCALAARIKLLLRQGLVLFCVPKENQKSTRYFRGAGGTNQGLLALDNPEGVVETEKS